MNVHEEIGKALQFHQAGRFDEAETIYNQILQIHPNHPDSLHYLGVMAHQRGQNDKAVNLIGRAIQLYPNIPIYYNNLAAAFKASDNLDQAAECYRQAIRLQPDYAEAYCNLGVILKCQNKPDDALSAYHKAIELNSAYPDSYKNMGAVFEEQSKLEDAIDSYRRFLNFKPNDADIYFRIAFAYHRKAEYDEAVAHYRKAIALKPDYLEAYNNLGAALRDQGKLDDAIACYKTLFDIDPNYAKAYNNMGAVYQTKGMYEEAMSCYRKTLEFEPDYAEAYNNLGAAFKDLGKLDESERQLKKAIEIQPEYADAYNNLGVVLQMQDRLIEAVSCFEKAIQFKPNYVEPLHNQALAFQGLNKLDEAVASYKKALEIKPEYHDSFCRMFHQLQHLADWKEVEKLRPKMDDLTVKALEKGEKPPEVTFENISRHIDPEQNYLVAKASGKEIVRVMETSKIDFSYEANRTHQKIIIGYLSNDFCSHPVAYQTLNLFGLHDRSCFEIRCYSYGIDDGSHYRKKIEKDADAFIDIRTFSVTDAARKIHEDQVDILVDLMGYTKGHRLGICALRPAPIQVTWLGFPGTTGADFFDYIIVDKTIAPPEHAAFFGEKLVYMPHTYMINDYQRPLGDKEWKRAELGLPSEGVIFCSFNRPYKIEPVMFDVWMKILKQVPGSVLWLQRIHPTAEKNLKDAAQERGVNPERLIFSDKVLSKDDHTARQPLADIALDTRIYNGHATTNDALWAGVPVITLAGGHFASLASAGFLHAVGLPELITHSLEAYESLAVRLARNPGELTALRQKLAKHRLTEPLFDTPRFVKNLEKAYNRMWELFLNKESPQLIEVRESEVKKKSEPAPVIRYPASVRGDILRACSLHQAGQIEQAQDIYNAVLRQYPDQPDALHLSGVICHQKGDYQNAIQLISQAIERVGNDWLYHNNLGAAYRHSYQLDLSLSCYRKAVEIKPDFAEGYYNIGIVLNEQEKAEESVFYYEKAIEIRPDYDEAVCTLLHELQLMCDWKKTERLSVRAKKMLENAASGKNITALMPFISVICDDQPALAHAVAKSWSDRVSVQMSQIRRKAVKRGVRRNAEDKRIRIGYLSSDFRNHPVASQMMNFFKLHNRAEFEIFCYSFGTNDGSHYRRHIEKDCDAFSDMQNIGYADAADRIVEDGIDILVDLMGHTNDNKLQIFALRPAPIQATWLGFPGTTGASFFDYIITDKTVTPLEHAPFYSEKFAYLPHTYMVNDYQLGISDKTWKRSDFGLPEHGFVFCSFNRSYKIEPILFDVWMKLLNAVPGSVLWLRRVSNISEKNLRQAAEERGVSSTRLIFTDKLPTKEEHISRHQLADLALDTRIYNGHATTNDALWAGVPVITLQGSHFASRAAAGFLKAVGLPELIVHSLQEYGELALKLAQSPAQLQHIRQKLSKHRLTEPLFNTPRFVRYIENAYKEMQRLYLNEQKPAHIEVRDAPASPKMLADAIRHHQAGQFKEAEVIYRALIETDPGHPNIPFYYSNLGAALQGQSDFEGAIACYRKALQLKPDMPEALANMNSAVQSAVYDYVRKAFEYRNQGDTDRAIAMFRKSLELAPDNPEILNNVGVLLKMQNRIEEAMASLRKALQVKPEFPEASFNMGLILKEHEGAEETALNCFQKAVDLKPDYIDAVFSLFQQYQDTCSWQNLNAVESRTRQITLEQLAAGVKTTDMPFNHLTHWDDPAKNMAVAKSWADALEGGKWKVESVKHKNNLTHNTSHITLTIGYVSGDFRNHPVGHLIAALFGRHDRSRFKVIAYSLCGDDGSPYRKRVERDCDQFVEISGLSDVQAAERIYQDGVDILIDLMGYTRAARTGIFAMRPAPVQLLWLGYPGTGGAKFFDYIIADKHVAPDEHTAFFAEKPIRMPHSYLLTDRDQPVSDKLIRRADLGLPEHAFVFCSFNRPYKIEPVIFDVWMSVLRQVPNSVLWLKHINALAEKNLRQEAANRGVNPDRLIFAPKWLAKDEHLARLTLADLVLDTRLFNGHSTSADALWAGVPVITMQGNHFASRVCSGLLSAVGLPELITYNLKNYESLAVRLAQNPPELNKIRQKLSKHRLTESLFDTSLFVRNLETAYQQMWKDFVSPHFPNPDELLHQGFAYQQAGNLPEAEKCYRQILATQPNHAEALHLLGVVAHCSKRYDEAIALISRAIQISPDDPNYYTNLGTAFKLRNKFDEAIMSYRKAVGIKPDFPEAWYNMGNALKAKKRMDEAFACYHRVIQLKPDYADAYNNMGTGLKDLGRLDEAVPYFQKALEVKPDFIEVNYNLGCVLKDMGKIEEAIPCFQKVVQFKPHFTEAYDSLAHQYQHACDWDAYPVLQRRIDELSRENLKKGLKAIENPFSNISRHADPAYNLEVARSWAEEIVESVKWKVLSAKCKNNITLNTSHLTHHTSHLKLRIGYLSNDFRNHPVAHLIAGLFKAHDRTAFEIFCYSYGWNDDSVYRQRIRQDCDRFVDLFGLNDEDAARQIREDGVDILIDLMGHTKSNRLEICALRPAPIQITYLGFPGTSGAKFFDYMITDKIVTPESHAQWYSEQLVFMPDCYQVNDHLQPISEKQIKRADVGLPENAFVFCSFNQPYKIEPVMFDVWMNILRQVPNSVLWLLWRSQITENNLKKEAQKRGIDPNRLIFAPKVSKDEHLARHKLADLALDTRIYNGHTTTSDALWAGVPVITVEGTHFASRVSSSILNAIGLPLIARNLQEYEAFAVRLAANTDELNIFRQKLAKHRLTQPLFDTQRFARNLENAYRQIWEIFSSGQSPRQIRVDHSCSISKGEVFSPPQPPIPAISPETAEQQAAYYNNLGTSLHGQRRVEEAIACFEKVIALKPDFYGVYNNLGLAYKDIGKYNESLECFQKVIQADPRYTKAYYNMGNLFQSRGMLNEAIQCYQKAVEVEPEYGKAVVNLFHRLRYICAWKDLPQMSARLDRITADSLAKGERPDETAFINITRVANPQHNFVVAKAWSYESSQRMTGLRPDFSFNRDRFVPKKLKIGYMSADFRDHPVSHLISELFGTHNRSEFEIFCYSYGEDDGRFYRQKIAQSCDHFTDMIQMSYVDAAKRIYEDGVDILVDLMGHTTNSRLEICVLRPAPIQMTWLGFAGTSGADFFDYIITDKVVSPPEHAQYYSEKLAYMPHCYMINNRLQAVSDKVFRRADVGLPGNAFVFSSFNQVYKFEPLMFDVWMRLLKQVPDSVLWLPTRNEIGEKNLRMEAGTRGVNPERLIFAPILPDKSEHLARMGLADLALDTRIYNGHATTSDALWAGIPVITLQGTHFASRAASSLLTAIGLPELITHSPEEYGQLALRLAAQPDQLRKIRQRLAKNRYTEPLFDTPRFVRDLEMLYKQIWKKLF